MPDELPKGWVKTNLGEICLPVETIRPKDSPDDEFTYFDIGGIDNERNCISDTKTVLSNLNIDWGHNAEKIICK